MGSARLQESCIALEVIGLLVFLSLSLEAIVKLVLFQLDIVTCMIPS